MYWYCTVVFGSRFQSFCNDWDSKFASASSDNDYDFLGRGCNINQGSFKNEFHYLSPVLNDGKSENVIDSSNGRDIRDGEVRMDLTDDLLHMVMISFFVLVVSPSPYSPPPCFWYCSSWWKVFSFLDHINLCQAAKVCRQWRTASAHEDFWKRLNFENRNLSLEQCENSIH